MSKTPSCSGCYHDFYNGRDNFSGTDCWHKKGAKAVTRYRIHRDTVPTQPRAFEKVRVWNCRTEQNFVLCKGLPDFVTPEEVERIHKEAPADGS